ncbi:UDP-4-amino-4,6-dideoxy-N-acetyl-beta-L-altrosamine transaminase [Hoeflea prorocentri]|uniref:UDP-4-amino-4, 6-dideoxy-N-acetyl-beta-L-altrosamine transaminase n=1 Tax=Hoeflea prorocentri TaxID=1922333 RepID=A0A9X3UNG8_9HYPH|nr:UDP-4-amino-4,6-dideoxy-N-acetyl-beta-L-altrosamine transaminase [Hoeflea prorocentri]MCY6383771.1 UDP-4-amino-4,6-dideoxy-N-acetyl-beta-L-altrosamine transaminase [Hoeflea prorocentri]MDA5401571.1 UDP-4-amino-4,6-dideoxy-N-acetyl-beta-L-altrosamine transaminase [Hoeflea prorocentri]
MIPYGRQTISQKDIDAVVDVLKSDFLTQGPAVERFEEAVAGYCTAQRAVSVSNATAALHLACLALGVGPGDLVWTSPVSFVASANCARYCGADVDFVDIDPDTVTMSVAALSDKLSEAAKKNRLPKVVIPVHLAGQSCAMEEIGRLADQYGFSVVEDASHAIGGTYQSEKVGNCRYSDIAVFSFHPVKIITTAEGGMAVTNQPQLADKMAMLRSHGITRDPELMDQPSDGPWYYQQLELGHNYRLTDIQAALGYSQLQKLDGFVARRTQLADRYGTLLQSLPLTLPVQPADTTSAWHLYVVRLMRDRIALDQRDVFEKLREAGIGVNLHYIPIHLQPYYRNLGFGPGDFPNAEGYYKEAISLPLFPALTDAEQDKVIEGLRLALEK